MTAPDYIDELAESLRLAWIEIERLKHEVAVVRVKNGDLERRVRRSWDKQGQTNTRLHRDLAHHVHHSFDTGITGEPLFREDESEAAS